MIVIVVKFKFMLLFVLNVVFRLCLLWKMYFWIELWRIVNRMENLLNFRIISRVDLYCFKIGFILFKENMVMLIGEILFYKFIIKFFCIIFI